MKDIADKSIDMILCDLPYILNEIYGLNKIPYNGKQLIIVYKM